MTPHGTHTTASRVKKGVWLYRGYYLVLHYTRIRIGEWESRWLIKLGNEVGKLLYSRATSKTAAMQWVDQKITDDQMPELRKGITL